METQFPEHALLPISASGTVDAAIAREVDPAPAMLEIERSAIHAGVGRCAPP
jgi:hypothetical protein